jgi:predicted RNA-binding Zn-ribbon protein involved in translation (DUF1610 family)
MIESDNNRMGNPRRRGRPSNAEISARTPAEPAKEVVIESRASYVALECPHCRRAMVPRVVTSHKLSRYANMPCCGAYVRIDYDQSGQAQMVQLISRVDNSIIP